MTNPKIVKEHLLYDVTTNEARLFGAALRGPTYCQSFHVSKSLRILALASLVVGIVVASSIGFSLLGIAVGLLWCLASGTLFALSKSYKHLEDKLKTNLVCFSTNTDCGLYNLLPSGLSGPYQEVYASIRRYHKITDKLPEGSFVEANDNIYDIIKEMHDVISDKIDLKKHVSGHRLSEEYQTLNSMSQELSNVVDQYESIVIDYNRKLSEEKNESIFKTLSILRTDAEHKHAAIGELMMGSVENDELLEAEKTIKG